MQTLVCVCFCYCAAYAVYRVYILYCCIFYEIELKPMHRYSRLGFDWTHWMHFVMPWSHITTCMNVIRVMVTLSSYSPWISVKGCLVLQL